MPLRAEPGESAMTTVFVDANGVAIGGCMGAFHREHAETIVGVLNSVLAGPPPSQKDRLN